jgi:hypothetical protein
VATSSAVLANDGEGVGGAGIPSHGMTIYVSAVRETGADRLYATHHSAGDSGEPRLVVHRSKLGRIIAAL